MKRMNLLLTIGAILILVVTISMMAWLRTRIADEIDRVVNTTARSLEEAPLLHGPGGDSLVRFEAAERLMNQAKLNPYIIQAWLTRFAPNGDEIPVVPYWALARAGSDWHNAVEGWASHRIGDADQPFGKLYVNVDRSLVSRINAAIAALGVALVLMLVMLIARVWSQESHLTRTMIELNERQRELIRMERLALAGELAAGVIHDLRKPVQNIRMNLDEINEALGDFAPAATSLHDLRSQAQLFFQILNETQIERFVQSDRIGEEYINLEPVIDQSVKLVRYERRGVNLVIEIEPNLPLLLAQPYRMVQLFSNLILNAYQAVQGKGTLHIGAHSENDEIVVNFQDDGPGIDPEVIERIFDPFFSTKTEGTSSGMGLAISRMIVDELGGRMDVKSQPGGPTRFTLGFPIPPASNNDPLQ